MFVIGHLTCLMQLVTLCVSFTFPIGLFTFFSVYISDLF